MPRTIDIDLPDLTGTRALVTGASDGMGLLIAARLAAAGAELVLPVRNLAKGETAAARIRESAPDARISLPAMDLSSLDSVTTAADRLLADGAPIHLLIGNAGVMTPPDRQTTADGFELQWGTNHLGHVALIGRLLPLLRDGGARVVSQLSVAASRGTVNWDDLNWERAYHGMRAYRQSKIAFGLFGLELDRRSRAEGWGISSALAHPGIAPTNLLAARPELGRAQATRGRRLIQWLSDRGILTGTVASAGLPALLAATTPDAGGKFFGPRGLGNASGPPAEQALYAPLRSAEDAARVWDVSLRLTGVSLAR